MQQEKSIIKKTIRIILILSICIGISPKLFSQGHAQKNIDYQLREDWIKSTIDKLKSFDVSEIEKKVSLKTRDKDGMLFQSYRINKEGLIEFGKKDWVYVVLHSSHHDDTIGDVAVARNKKGKTFVHYGHNCGMIAHYDVLAPKIFNSSKDFFLHFKSDVDDLPWEKYGK